MNIKALLLFFALIAGLVACTKTNNDILVTEKTTTLNVINAATDTLNFYQNGTRLNNNSNLYPFGSLDRLEVKAGPQNFQFKKAGSPNTLINIAYTLNADSLHSLFVAGQSPDKVFLLTDKLVTDTGAIYSRVRYVNASPIAGNLDVVIGSAFNYKNIAFKSATPFLRVSSGKNTLTIYQSGVATPLAAGTITLAANRSYTVFTKGVLNGTGNNLFGARIVISN